VEYAVASDEEIIKQRKLEERLIENWNKAFQKGTLTKLIAYGVWNAKVTMK
jgi:hypothetical protein